MSRSEMESKCFEISYQGMEWIGAEEELRRLIAGTESEVLEAVIKEYNEEKEGL